MFKVGQQVRFVGRKSEQGKYHPEYAQLLGQIGTVMGGDSFAYMVRFEGFEWSGEIQSWMEYIPPDWFTVFLDELEAV